MSKLQAGAGLATVRLDDVRHERGDDGNSIRMCYSGKLYDEVFKRPS